MSHKKTGRKHQAKSLGDITLNDFANASVAKSRLKKSNDNVKVVMKKEVETSWEDKEFDGDFVAEENEDGTLSYVIKKLDTRIRKKTGSSSSEDKIDNESSGNDYPIDIWFTISDYIHPEDVGCFAAICKTSFEVVCTARFWFNLYRRYYDHKYKLPEQLQPECLVRKYGLRTSVIRALYIMYPPFIKRVKAIITFEHHPDILKRRLCSLLWYQKQKDHWVYYFKLKQKVDVCVQRSTRMGATLPDILELLDDVFANPDEHCRILQVTCLHFIPIPVVIGLTLTSVALTLSQGFRHHRLHLMFDSGINSTVKSIQDASGCTHVILDPVVNIKILDWWHPLYPHLKHSIGELLSQD